MIISVKADYGWIRQKPNPHSTNETGILTPVVTANGEKNQENCPSKKKSGLPENLFRAINLTHLRH